MNCESRGGFFTAGCIGLQNERVKTFSVPLLVGVLHSFAFAAAPATPRPADAAKGIAVAKVLFSEGAVQVTDSAHLRFAVGDGLPLTETDVLHVPAAAFVLVQVNANTRVARIDDDVDLALKDLAVLHASPLSQSLEEQLEGLLTSSEKTKLKERLTGWLSAPVAGIVPTEESARSATGGGASPGDTGASTRQPRFEAADDEKPQGSKHDADSELPRATPVKPARTEPTFKRGRVSDQSTRLVVAPAAASCDLHADARLTQCLTAQALAFKVTRGPLKIRYVFDGGAWRVVLSYGLPVPACATDWFAKQRVCEQQPWRSLEVPLK